VPVDPTDAPPVPAPATPKRPSPADLDPACAEARREREAAERRGEALRQARDALLAAQHAQDLASRDLDRRAIADRKADALRAYRTAVAAAADDEQARRAAIATWFRDVDRINRRTRVATRQLAQSRAVLAELEARTRSTDLEAAAARIRAESAEARCAEARRRVAADDDASGEAPGEPAWDAVEWVASPATGEIDDAPVAVRRVGVPADAPLVRRLVAGDRDTHQALGAELAEMSGSVAARSVLLLHELVDALAAAAVEAGELAFDHSHPFWAQFSPAEAREITGALRRIGFRFDLEDGWYGGRVPTPTDLASAISWMGQDLRGLRVQPTAAELRELPGSVMVATHEHLRRTAPDLTLDQLTAAVGSRAARLGELWNEWGRLRSLLLEASSATA
jgi:hypothetical protein